MRLSLTRCCGWAQSGARVSNASRAAVLWLALLAAVRCSQTFAQRVDGISDSGSTTAVEPLYRAERWVDEGNLRQAAASLDRIVDGDLKEAKPGARTRSAVRLLTLIYRRSGDFERAVEMGERWERLTLGRYRGASVASRMNRAEMAATMADAYLALGRNRDAGRELHALREALTDAPPVTLEQAQWAFEAARLERELNLATEGLQPADTSPTADSPRAKTLVQIVDPERMADDQRFRAVALQVDQWLGADAYEEAIEFLKREIQSPAYVDQERSDLTFRLADCYEQQAAGFMEEGLLADWYLATSRRHRLLVQILEELSDRSSNRAAAGDASRGDVTAPAATDGALELVKQLDHEAAIHEELAEIAADLQLMKDQQQDLPDLRAGPAHQGTAAEHLKKAVDLYRELGRQVEAFAPAARGNEEMSQASLAASATQYRESSLCGLQRVLEALRHEPQGGAGDIYAQLREVSEQLVEMRTRRMLPSDPGLLDAKRALACVYASSSDYHRADPIFRELVGQWEDRSQQQPAKYAQALLDLAETLRALDETRQAYHFARQAQQTADRIDPDGLEMSQRDLMTLKAQIDNSLGVIAIALGNYQDALQYVAAADEKLAPYEAAAAEQRMQNERTLHVLSQAKAYRALLHKAEAQYKDAAIRIREGRELRQLSGESLDLLPYHLAEASIFLAEAKSLAHQKRNAQQDQEFTHALEQAQISLDRARPLIEPNRDAEAVRLADRNYHYLRGILLRLRGDYRRASDLFLSLAQQSEQENDRVLAAKCYMELALLTATTPRNVGGAHAAAAGAPTRSDAQRMKSEKVDARATFQQAAQYVEKSVGLFQQLEGASTDEDEATAYPSLHFQASFLTAQLHILLDILESHIHQLDGLLAQDTSPVGNAQSGAQDLTAATPQISSHRRHAIEYLEDAIRQAEQPASTTTRARADRADYFSRYAPAYDLLVDLYVAEAAGDAAEISAQRSSKQYRLLRRAIEVADLARNRTFREQIAGWQEAGGNASRTASFDWDREIEELVGPDTVLLIYHLGGRGAAKGLGQQKGKLGQTIGGSHLFVIRDGGEEIRYYRLKDYLADSAAGPPDLTRGAAAGHVAQEVSWVTGQLPSRQWGPRSQRALTASVLPPSLLPLLTDSRPEPRKRTKGRITAASVQKGSQPLPPTRLVIIPDGALHQLPFECLLMPSLPDRLLSQYGLDVLPPIRYGPSLSVLAAIAHDEPDERGSHSSILTVGDPQYPPADTQRTLPSWGRLFSQVSTLGVFTPLHYSEHECEAVYASFDDPVWTRTKLLQADATEANVRSHIERSRYVHIAAHGFVDHDEDNLIGALVLSPNMGSSSTEDDGLLQLQEIYGLDLSRCDLAVLSACQTYVGAHRPLEAGMSMARAFLEQGARRVMCSHWNVDDEASAELIENFFHFVQSAQQDGGQVDYAEALYTAKRKLREDPRWRSRPIYWSPFVLVGCP